LQYGEFLAEAVTVEGFIPALYSPMFDGRTRLFGAKKAEPRLIAHLWRVATNLEYLELSGNLKLKLNVMEKSGNLKKNAKYQGNIKELSLLSFNTC